MEIALLTRDEITEIIRQATETTAAQIEIMHISEVMTLPELCDYLRVTPPTVRARIKDQKLPVTYKLGHPRFLKSEIDAWLKER